MDKIPVTDSLGNKIGDFVPNGNGCGSGIFGAISLLLFSWVHMFSDIMNRPNVWSETTNKSLKKYWLIAVLLFVNLLGFLLSALVGGFALIIENGNVSVLSALSMVGLYITGIVGSILFLIFTILFFNDIRGGN